jgi:hypothetical protein
MLSGGDGGIAVGVAGVAVDTENRYYFYPREKRAPPLLASSDSLFLPLGTFAFSLIPLKEEFTPPSLGTKDSLEASKIDVVMQTWPKS